MKELIEQVVQWGVDRDLDKSGHESQTKYILKETAKLLDAYADQDISRINEAIGKILARTIISGSNDEESLNGLNSRLSLEYFGDKGSIYGSIMVSYVMIVESERCLLLSISSGNNEHSKHYELIVDKLLQMLFIVNNEFNQKLSLEDCLQIAYNDLAK